jgi:hypothetical protein
MCNLLSRKPKGENAEYIKYLGSMITSDTKYTREIKSRIVMTK